MKKLYKSQRMDNTRWV